LIIFFGVRDGSLGISAFPPPTVSSHDEPGVAEIAKAERLRNRTGTSKYPRGCVTRGIGRAANIG